MNIISDFRKDTPRTVRKPGGYEWWYFDAVSLDDKYRFVIIFYRGNPFSNRYIKQLQGEHCAPPAPSDYPAVSISTYEYDDPIYYSFTEFQAKDCLFNDPFLSIGIGPHKLKGSVKKDKLIYELEMNEILPSGDQIEAEITFKSQAVNSSLFADQTDDSIDHMWNLVQPLAEVQGRIKISDDLDTIRNIEFTGSGYHDHNTGKEPMRNEFTDWYWGRIHFKYATLVFYVMNKKTSQQHQAWLISNNNSHILCKFDDITLSAHTHSVFGLSTARKITLQSDQAQIYIQQRQLLDNGPFYQRFKNDGFLRIVSGDIVESREGISEYIHPNRIYSRIFWPLVNMRIQYTTEGPHWVQRWKKLYRWTW